ncbi:hypothetical protein ELQ35_19670 [Peribacillus cavernae]|uniref:Uncharacterized protein n=1 Tax=Peribacillus cavernae TaxID=1674310 RepID=A0A3S0TXF1_9BACI|nr:DUF5370 family protein [Peribacillus cavernae]RUQ25839.1 hypothetical protein ELQ35_19670 [Peribacillus cavernae]
MGWFYNRFTKEPSVINQNGAIHVYNNGEFIEEIKFSFSEKVPNLDQIEQLMDTYCDQRGIRFIQGQIVN